MKLKILNKQRKIIKPKITQEQVMSDKSIDIFAFSLNYDAHQAVNENKEYVEDEDKEYEKINEYYEDDENGEEENKDDKENNHDH